MPLLSSRGINVTIRFHAGRRVPNAVAGLLFVFCAWTGVAVSAPDASLWSDVAEAGLARSASERQIVPVHYRTVRLDLARFEAGMAQVPAEQDVALQASAEELELPMPDGSSARFRIVESPVMAPGLAKRFPGIRTWVGQGIDDVSTTLRFDLTHKGFHAQVLSPQGTVYIDPYQTGDREHYISYHKHDHHHGEQVRCEVTGEDISEESLAEHLAHAAPMVSSGAQLRTYRLAVAATGEYTQFHGGSVMDGLAGIVTTINRVNGIYEREVSVRMVLVDDNDRVIHTNAATDPFSNTSSDLGEVVRHINSEIGLANYDVGHLVGTGGGGVAGLGVICGESKARGLTGSPSPVGDGFDVDYVAHELGHQFGGNHTFNGSGGNCSVGNRNGSTAYEPGSGVTIQAYAGICGNDNLQPNSEDFFHRVSLNEIIAHTTTGSGGNCGVLTPTGNAVPTVSTPAQFQIPARTPFELEAQGADADGDVLTYAWEQFDRGPANSTGVLADDGTRALFRVFQPSRQPVRIFPSLRYILGHANTPPSQLPLPGTTAPNFFTGELLPTTNRDLNFRVTVRDNRAGGGGTNEASTTLKVNAGAGPFVITAPNTAVSWTAGSSQTVSWNVANTQQAPILASQVQILLSVDGGYSWPVLLAAAVPNSGNATVVIPAGLVSTQRARIKVKAVGNVFFDISDTDFSIVGNNTVPQIQVTGTISTRQGSPGGSAQVASVSDAEDAAAGLQVSVAEAPEDLAVVVENTGGNVGMSIAASCTLVAPGSGTRIYPVRLEVIDSGGATNSGLVNVLVGANQAPVLGQYSGLTMVRNAVMTLAATLPPEDPNGNLSQLTVSPAVLPGGGSLAVAEDGLVTVTTTSGTAYGSYPVQVRAIDSCGATEIRAFTLEVMPTVAELSVAGVQVPGGNGLIEPGECNELVLTLANTGTVTATQVTAAASTATSGASLFQSVMAFPDIPPGESRSGLAPFQLSTANGMACFSSVALDLVVQYEGGDGPLLETVVLDVGQAGSSNYQFTVSNGVALPSGGSRINGSNADDALVDVNVPFAFSLYEQDYPANTTLRASTNGTLQFSSSGGSTAWSNQPLPSAGTNNGNSFPATAPTMMPFWDDLRLDTTDGGIYTYLTGTPPERRYVIVWQGKPYANTGGGSSNTRFAVVLHENSSDFDFVYEATAAGTASSGGASATIGVQAGSSGSNYTGYSFDSASVTPGMVLSATRPQTICAIGGGACGGPAIFKDGFEPEPVLKRWPQR